MQLIELASQIWNTHFKCKQNVRNGLWNKCNSSFMVLREVG